MIADGREALSTWRRTPRWIPAAVMFATVLSLNFLGDMVRNMVDPRRSALRPNAAAPLGARRAGGLLHGARSVARRRWRVVRPRTRAGPWASSATGVGKSVLVRSLIGLVSASSGAEVAGQVLLEGRDLRAPTAKEFRGCWGSDIGIVLQDPMTSLNPVMKIGRQIGEGLRPNRGSTPRPAARRAVELLGEVGIPEVERRAMKYPH